MNSLHMRAFGAKRCVALLGTASVLTMAGVTAAKAQQTAAASVEQVLVTGSLIRGAAAVGVPVKALSEADFKESGAVTIADMFKSVPSVVIVPTQNSASGHSSSERGQAMSIHNLDSTAAVPDLLLVDSMRFPAQGHSGKEIDPSIVPSIALERVDVLADGASATYGSDAISGVVNVILKRGFNGAEVADAMGAEPQFALAIA